MHSAGWDWESYLTGEEEQPDDDEIDDEVGFIDGCERVEDGDQEIRQSSENAREDESDFAQAIAKAAAETTTSSKLRRKAAANTSRSGSVIVANSNSLHPPGNNLTF